MFQGRKKAGETQLKLQKEKEKILTELSKTVKELQKHVLTTGCFEISKNDGNALRLTCTLEAIFLHGYQAAVSVSGLFNKSSSSGVLPTPDFWQVLGPSTHKDVLHQISHLSHVTTLVGKCRAWLRLALNDGLMESYLQAILSDKKKLSQQYSPKSFLRDEEATSITMNHFLGLTALNFDLNYNTPSLNQWTVSALQLSGAWQPTSAPDATMARQADLPGPPSFPAKVSKEKTAPSSVRKQSSTNQQRNEQRKETKIPPPVTAVVTEREVTQSVQQDEDMVDKSENKEIEVVHDTANDETQEDSQKLVVDETEDLPSAKMEDDPAPAVNRPVGNKLGMSCGWSSSFEAEPANTTAAPPQVDAGEVSPIKHTTSFHGILRGYHVGGTKKFEPTDQAGQQLLPEEQIIGGEDSHAYSQEILNLKNADFEVIGVASSPEESFMQKRNMALLSTVNDIAREKGLNAQDYKCTGCSRPIGMIYGQYKVCSYDGSYYCYECHSDDEHVIPARIVHNWDLNKYKVAKHTKLFLMQMDEEPIFHIDEVNPTLYNIISEMNKAKTLRVQLRHLKGYVMTCRSSMIAEDVKRRMWPREYLWDDIHQYSLLDLLQVSSGQLQHHLRKIITFCKKHVYACESCCQKGFVCEICKNPKILYAFELNYTSQCSRCHAVFHKQCKLTEQCPRCIRRHSRRQRSEPTTKVDDKLDYLF